MIAKKAQLALQNNITPILCVQSEETPVPKECNIIAYEPVWAIGSGNPDTPQNAGEIARRLKNTGSNIDLKVLYGGSVTSKNVRSFIYQENISGVLVGKASLDAEEFIKICQAAAE